MPEVSSLYESFERAGLKRFNKNLKRPHPRRPPQHPTRKPSERRSQMNAARRTAGLATP